MGTFAISCDLLDQDLDHQLHHELERLRAHKATDSLYFVHLSTDNPHAIRDHLAQYIGERDRIVVVRFIGRPACKFAYEGTDKWAAVNVE